MNRQYKIILCTGRDRLQVNQLLDKGWEVITAFPIVTTNSPMSDTSRVPVVEYVLSKEK